MRSYLKKHTQVHIEKGRKMRRDFTLIVHFLLFLGAGRGDIIDNEVKWKLLMFAYMKNSCWKVYLAWWNPECLPSATGCPFSVNKQTLLLLWLGIFTQSSVIARHDAVLTMINTK